MTTDRQPPSPDEQRGANALAKLMAVARDNYNEGASNTGTKIIRPRRQRRDDRGEESRDTGDRPR